MGFQKMSKAGNIEIDIYEPYPAWCVVSHQGKELIRLHHNELSDLKYATEKAMQEASLKLKNKDEVYT